MSSLKMTPELAEALAVLDDADRIGVSPSYLVQTVLKKYRDALDAVPQPTIDDLDARMPEAVLQRAVIEAAKAQEKEYARYLDNSRKSPSANLLAYRVACTATNIAVSALQEVEGE